MSRIRECLKEKGNILYDKHLYLDYFRDFTGKIFSDPDCFCTIKPYSMTSGGNRGCQGAIWGSGDPASKYCKDDNRFPWWQNCCTWKWGSYWNPITKLDKDGYGCFPKLSMYCTKIFRIFLHTFYSQIIIYLFIFRIWIKW